MRHVFRLLGLGAVLAVLAATGVANAICPVPTGVNVKIPPGAHLAVLYGVPSAPPGGEISIFSMPRHGALEVKNGEYLYRPFSSFWTLGSDRFLVRLDHPWKASEVVSVRIFPAQKKILGPTEDFEADPVTTSGWERVGAPVLATIDKTARMNGELGLLMQSGPAESDVGVLSPPFFGGGAQGSGATGGWKPPGGGGPGGFCGEACVGDTEATILSHLDTSGAPRIWVRMRSTSTGVSLQLRSHESSPEKSWIPVSQAEHRIDLLTRAPYNGLPGVAMLWLDGELIDQLTSESINSNLVNNGRFEFGLRDVVGANTTAMFDHLASYRLLAGEMAAKVECEDDFDSGALDPLWQAVGSNEVAMSFNGLGSLIVEPDAAGNPPGAWVAAHQLQLLSFGRLGLRVDVDLSELVVPSGTSVILVESINTFGSRAFRVAIDGLSGGAARMRVFARHDDLGQTPITATFPITLAPHTIELDWRGSETNAKGLGTLRLWLDGIKQVDHRSLLTPEMKFFDVRFGAVSNVGLATGEVKLDQIEVWTEP